jgi:hypothetical protein
VTLLRCIDTIDTQQDSLAHGSRNPRSLKLDGVTIYDSQHSPIMKNELGIAPLRMGRRDSQTENDESSNKQFHFVSLWYIIGR